MAEPRFPQQVNQVGIVVKDLDKAIQFYSQVFGLGPFRAWELALPEVVSRGKRMPLKMKLAFASLGPIQFELIEAPPGDNIYREFLETRGEGLHHLGFDVSDLEAQLSQVKKQGIGVLLSGGTERVSFAYLDSGQTGGVIFELIQRRSG